MRALHKFEPRGGSASFVGPMQEPQQMELVERVSHLGQDLTSVKADVAVLKTDVRVLKTDVAELKADVGALKTDMAVVKTDIAGLKNDVAVLKIDTAGLKTDMAVVKSNYATKADVLEAKNSVIVWVVSAIFFAQLLPGFLKKLGL